MSDFRDALERVFRELYGEWEEEDMAKKKQAAKWNPETLRATALKVSCANGPFVSEVVEALDAAASEIERLSESVKWAYIRSMQRRKG